MTPVLGPPQTRRRACAAVAAALALLATVACQLPEDSPSRSPAPQSTGTNPVGSLPELVGRGLQNAQDTAQQAGYQRLVSHDALGRGRHQILDREWQVCFQEPPPGTAPTSVTVDLGAVRLDETCPPADRAESTPGPAADTMPDLVGTSVAVARDSLGRGASIRFVDATGADRTVIVATNWQVCAQQPAPGEPFNGAPVTLTVATFTEPC